MNSLCLIKSLAKHGDSREKERHGSERKMAHDVLPFSRLGGGGYELEIQNVPPNRGANLVAKKQARERSPLTLPILGQRPEANILSESYPAKVPGSFQQFVVFFRIDAVFDGCEYIDAAAPKLLCDCQGNVDVHVQSQRHLTCFSRPEPENDR